MIIMTLRTQEAVGVAIAIGLIILPLIIVQAQSEGETEVPAAEETADIEQTATEVTTPQEESAAAEAEQGTAVAQEDDPPAAEGEVLDESDAAAEEPGAAEPTATTSETETFVGLAASSTEATSTPPVEEPKPVEEPFVLQPAVTLHISGSSIAADIELENLTCKSCEKVLPAAQVKAYYTAWYPNDGPDLKEVSEHLAEHEVNVSDVALWASRSMSWSATDVAPGRYYFVIAVDPENAIGAYRIHRSEFSI